MFKTLTLKEDQYHFEGNVEESYKTQIQGNEITILWNTKKINLLELTEYKVN
jgi:hypothetical protein